eukprot:TRINITY_DN3235_c0_g1_i4.p1 TRINITY_DN3235_c0_g1~~TRINITY_DN3235_c0_g1_i4.p1  ORF type:complete len:464 (-),score=40.59 TRINITY_DN3235_c0_g1_i4:469-1737(-)
MTSDNSGREVDAINYDYLFSQSELQDLLNIFDNNNGLDEIPASSLPTNLANIDQPLALQFQAHFTGPVPVVNNQDLENKEDQQIFQHASLTKLQQNNIQQQQQQQQQQSLWSKTISSVKVVQSDNLQQSLLNFSNSGTPQVIAGQIPSTQGMTNQFNQEVINYEYTISSQKSPNIIGQKRDQGRHTISHSLIEKQRRDRINSLIDELRELVPPQNCQDTSEATKAEVSNKRPKHVVLYDTISMLKELKDKLKNMTEEIEQLKSGYSGDVSQEGEEQTTSQQINSSNNINIIQQMELPSPPQNSNKLDYGVFVEAGPTDESMYVKVCCNDRRGLLCDIIDALRSLPLEIKTAAVTTDNSSIVNDVFEIRHVQGSDVSREQIQKCVFDSVFNSKFIVGEKRRRVSFDCASGDFDVGEIQDDIQQ